MKALFINCDQPLVIEAYTELHNILLISCNFQGQRLYNVNAEQTEKVGRLMIVYADDFKEVSSVKSGNIIVVTGLKVKVLGVFKAVRQQRNLYILDFFFFSKDSPFK